MFLSEVAPFNYRGAFGTLHQLFVTFGIFLSSVFGLEQLLGMRSTRACLKTTQKSLSPPPHHHRHHYHQLTTTTTTTTTITTTTSLVIPITRPTISTTTTTVL